MSLLSPEFFNDRWARGNVPIKLRGLRFEDYEATSTSGEIALMKAQDFVEDFGDRYISSARAKAGKYPEDRTNIGKGLMLYGRNGTRKTTLATTILTELQYKSKSLAYYGFYIRFSEWQRCLTDTFTSEVTERVVEAKTMLEKTNNAPFVILDDVGQEYRNAKSGFTQDKFHELVRIRYESAKPTIITTNLDPEQMREVYGASFDSFRHDAFEEVLMLGRDTRKPKRN